MADWNNPLTTTAYATFVTEVKARDEDAAKLADSPTNPPTGYKRWNASTKILEEWSGSAWTALVLGLTGGGTGANSAAGARTSLGIGTMGVQNSDAVSITGGSIAGLTNLTLASTLKFDTDNAYDIGEDAKRPRYVYIKSGLVLPVGTDKWVPA